MKTKLGISVGLLGAIVYMIGLFGGYVPLFLLAGYLLIIEKNEWLSFVAKKTICLAVVFSVLDVLVNIIPNISLLINGFDVSYRQMATYTGQSQLILSLTSIINVLKVIIFFTLSIRAFKMKNIKTPLIDDLIKNK